MANRIARYHRTIALRCASAICLLTAYAVSAAVVWDLNPSDVNAPVGSSSHVFTSQTFSITAYGFDNHNGIGSAHELFFKSSTPINGASEIGLGLVGTHDNELQVSAGGTPLQFIQFDLGSIIGAGLLNGKVSVGSIQAGEAFAIYGSNTLGTLGTELQDNIGSAFDNKFVNLPDFGLYKYYSIAAAAVDVLPVSISADIPAIPEMNALLPIVGLLVAIASTQAVRRRRALRVS